VEAGVDRPDVFCTTLAVIGNLLCELKLQVVVCVDTRADLGVDCRTQHIRGVGAALPAATRELAICPDTALTSPTHAAFRVGIR